MRHVSAIALLILAAGCTSTADFTTRYHEDGRAKPIASIAPMLDTTSFDLPWSLSEEFTSAVASQVGQNGKVYVIPQKEDFFSENPFSQDLSWIKKEFPDREFVVFLELIEHDIVPTAKLKQPFSPQEQSTNLNIAVRLRVIDVRSQAPKIVLQEMIKDSYFIPKTLIPHDYNVTVWGTPEFQKSPMGIAHAQIVKEIGARVVDYVLLAKSR